MRAQAAVSLRSDQVVRMMSSVVLLGAPGDALRKEASRPLTLASKIVVAKPAATVTAEDEPRKAKVPEA